MVAQVRATALLDFPAVALEAGIDPHAALRKAGIDASLIMRGDMTIPAERVAVFRRAFDLSMADAGCRDEAPRHQG